MKKIIVALTLAITLLVASVVPVFAAPPALEEWDLFAFLDGQIRVTMTINTNTLKSDHFDVYNQSADVWIRLYVRQNGVIVWENWVGPNTNQEYTQSINFSRLPATDPDNPNSIRYPANISFGANLSTVAP